MRVPRRTAPRRVALAVVTLATLLVAVPGLTAAATVEEIRTFAELIDGWAMKCTVPSAGQVTCISRAHPGWTALIRPETGPEQELDTSAVVADSPLDPISISWMSQMHGLACGSDKAVSAFVQTVAQLLKPQDVAPAVIGNCTFHGSFVAPASSAPYYIVSSVVLPPPSPSPKPTVKPTVKPTHTPAPSPSAAPTASVAPSATPSAAPSASPSVSPTLAPTPSPTPAVDPAATSGPAGSEPPGAGAPTPAPTAPTFDQSVLGITDVNADGGAIGGSLLLALLMLLIIGFAGELFNNTVENNYMEISGWFRKGPLGWLRRMGGKLGGEARVGLLVFLGLTALVSSFVDPHFGLDLRSLAEFLGFLVGLIVVLASFKLPMMLAHKRKTGELGKLRPLPWALVIAALFVLVSRLGGLQPGYLYGIVLGAIFVKDVSDAEEGRETFYGSFWTLGAAVLAWVALGWVRGLGYDPNGFGVTLLSTAFAAILVAGLEATAFGLMPLRFMPGHTVYKWNRIGWALLFGLSVFGFIHLLISPTSGYVSDLSPQAFIAACGVFATFGALSILTWGYFRFRPETAGSRLER